VKRDNILLSVLFRMAGSFFIRTNFVLKKNCVFLPGKFFILYPKLYFHNFDIIWGMSFYVYFTSIRLLLLD